MQTRAASLQEVCLAPGTPGGGVDPPCTLPSSGSRLGVGSVRASHAPLDCPLRARTSTWGGGGRRRVGVGKSGSGVRPLTPRRGLLPELHFLRPFLRPLLGNSHWPTSTSTKIKTDYPFLEIPSRLPYSRAKGLQFYLGNFDSSPPRIFEPPAPSPLLRILQPGLEIRVIGFFLDWDPQVLFETQNSFSLPTYTFQANH